MAVLVGLALVIGAMLRPDVIWSLMLGAFGLFPDFRAQGRQYQ